MPLSKFEDLPTDITEVILEYLGIGDLARLCKSSKILNDFIVPRYKLLLLGPKTEESARFKSVSNEGLELLESTLESDHAHLIETAVVNLTTSGCSSNKAFDLLLALPNLHRLAIYASTQADYYLDRLSLEINFDKIKNVKFATAKKGTYTLLPFIGSQDRLLLVRLILSLNGCFKWEDFKRIVKAALSSHKLHFEGVTIRFDYGDISMLGLDSTGLSREYTVDGNSLRFARHINQDVDLICDIRVNRRFSRDVALYLKSGEVFEMIDDTDTVTHHQEEEQYRSDAYGMGFLSENESF